VSAEALTKSAQEAIRLAEKATAGPWEQARHDFQTNRIYSRPAELVAELPTQTPAEFTDDSRFIIAARTIVPSQARIILSLVETIKAAQRLVANVYIDWRHAGGVDDCKHGYGKGIPCRKCDEAAVATAFADAMKGE
jgi:hypothetical protein